LEHIRQLLGGSSEATLTDGQLLHKYVHSGDEAAFAALLQRHGPMVLGVCRRLLRTPQDVDDAFQATFLVLIRKAGSIAKEESVGSWLYGVAYRTAIRARTQLRNRHRREMAMADIPQEVPPGAEGREMQLLLDQELRGLPEKYRAPLVLHYLAGKTKDETARQLGWTEGTVSGRLARARQLLRVRLARRGLDLSAGLVALGLAQSGASGAVPVGLLDTTLRAACRFTAGLAAGGVLSAPAVRLAEGVVRSFLLAQVKIGAGLLLMISALAASAVLVAWQLLPPRSTANRQGTLLSALTPARPLPSAPGRVRKDLLGDPLPPGVLVRLGTNRGRHGHNLSSLDFSKDGKWLATRAQDGVVRVWEAATGRELHALRGKPGTPGVGLWCFAFAPNGRTMATGGADGMVRFWDPASGQQLREVKGNNVGVRALAFSSDGKVLAVAGEDNRLSLWDPAEWKEIRCLCSANSDPRPELTPLPVKEMRFSPDGKTLEVFRLPVGGWVSDFSSSRLELWEVATGRQRCQCPMWSFSRTWAFTPDGKAFVWMERGGKVSLKAADTGRETRTFHGTDSRSNTLALDAHGRTLAVASDDSVRLWEMATQKQGRVLEDSAGITCLAFSRNGQTLAAGSFDGTFQLWNVATGQKLLKPGPGHRGYVGCLAYSPDGKTLATGSVSEGTIRLWQASMGREIRSWEAHRGQPAPRNGPMALAFSPDGKTLASSGSDQAVRFWLVSTGKEIRHFRAGQKPEIYPYALQFSPDGKYLAAPDSDGAVCLWRVTGRQIRRWKTSGPPFFPGNNWRLAFAADGKLLAASRGKVVYLWETTTGHEVRRFESPAANVTALAFSTDRRTLALAGKDDTVCLTEIATGKERTLHAEVNLPDRLDSNGIRVRHPPTGYFTGLVFCPDGRTLFGTGRTDNAIYVWNLTGNRPAGRVFGHNGYVSCLALSRDSKTLASASADSTVLVWNVAQIRALSDPERIIKTTD
jgi:RNA polymerase sigma factor (sigma-70 family)